MLIIDYYVVDKAINIFYVFFTCPVSAQYDRKAGGRPDVGAVPAHQLPQTSPVPLAHLNELQFSKWQCPEIFLYFFN